MRNRILSVYPGANFVSYNAGYIYIADFTERTNCARGVEVHCSLPEDPGNCEGKMDCLKLCNEEMLSIDFHIFGNHQFKNEKNEDMSHCECCFFPTEDNQDRWVSFLEIKDCKPKNIAGYKEEVKKQIILTVELFRQKGVIKSQAVYGIISFPRRKAAFDQTIFEDYTEYKKLYESEKIRFLATNHVIVRSCKKGICQI